MPDFRLYQIIIFLLHTVYINTLGKLVLEFLYEDPLSAIGHINPAVSGILKISYLVNHLPVNKRKDRPVNNYRLKKIRQVQIQAFRSAQGTMKNPKTDIQRRLIDFIRESSIEQSISKTDHCVQRILRRSSGPLRKFKILSCHNRVKTLKVFLSGLRL